MVRLLILGSLLLPTTLHASDVFQYRDGNGRVVFSDTAPAQPHDVIDIEIQNDYDWSTPSGKFKPARLKKPRKGRKRKKKTRRYTLAELQDNCRAARYRYQNYRGKQSKSDWGSYKKKLGKLAAKRDHWCSRVLKGH